MFHSRVSLMIVSANMLYIAVRLLNSILMADRNVTPKSFNVHVANLSFDCEVLFLSKLAKSRSVISVIHLAYDYYS